MIDRHLARRSLDPTRKTLTIRRFRRKINARVRRIAETLSAKICPCTDCQARRDKEARQ